jgi:biotin-dependent carboxylase-like uncharacterized protein
MATERSLHIVGTGAQTTVQDAGRPGLAHLGVGRSGWLDDPAARLANRLVGNAEDVALLECLLGGLVTEPDGAVSVAVTGAECEVRAGGRAVAHGAAVGLRSGEALSIGPVSRGARCYVAVAGGIAVEAVLGSRSTDTLSGIGPEAVQPGDVLPVGSTRGTRPGEGQQLTARHEGVQVLRCWPGPRTDWFTDAALTTLTTLSYSVHPHSDRVGLRLSGPALERRTSAELPSEGLVLGAVQVPGDGRPLVFLNDHPTTGGYPVVAVVDPRDLSACAQLRPGDEVRFHPQRRLSGAGD